MPLLLAVIGIGLLIALRVVRTAMKRRACEAGIQQCEERIKKARPLADRNRELQTDHRLEPTVALVKDAQQSRCVGWASWGARRERSNRDRCISPSSTSR